MKVLYITPTPSMYGDNIALIKVMPIFIENGVEPYFIVSRKGPFTEELEKCGLNYSIQLIRDTMYPPTHNLLDTVLFIPRILKKLYVNFLAYKKLLPIVEQQNPDLIHSNISTCDIGFRIARKLNVKHVWHVRELGKKDKGYDYFPSKKNFEKKLTSQNNYPIFITKVVRDNFSISGEYSIIYDGVSSKENLLTHVSNKLNQFLFVGRLTKSKGVDLLIDAYIEFSKKAPYLSTQFKLIVAGEFDDYSFENGIKKKIANNNLINQIEFIGYSKDAYKLMEQSKGLIITSTFEAFGFITAEGMLNGCLIIGRDTGGTKEQMDNAYDLKKQDLSLRFKTVEELSNHLVTVAGSNYSDYNDKILDANQIANQLYTIKKSSQKILNVYRKLYESKSDCNVPSSISSHS
jgi:L-malate glycosyltransferase